MELANQIVEVDSELDLLLQSSENRDAIAETDQLFVELEPAYKNLAVPKYDWSKTVTLKGEPERHANSCA